jgi:POT family proton-dependent oligopeptide transporter
MAEESTVQRETMFGHPVGLFTLFFSEMWERFSYYGMRALLVFYMIKGFLSYSDDRAYGVYGAYTALVYATGFIGGWFADRLLGQRRAAVLGGLLMAGGHLMMTQEHTTAFYLALGLLVVGNGFFKPNVSTIVGTLYPEGSPRRDGGFTIYYMGVNLGATLAPLVCGYIGERYGWHWGFGLATIGMLVGLAVFVAPVRLTQFLILGTAVATAISMLFFKENIYQLIVNVFAGVALVIAGVAAYVALGRGGLPENAGAPPDREFLLRKIGPFRIDMLIYFGVILSVPIFALLSQQDKLAAWILYGFGSLALLYVMIEAARGTKIERERLYVVLVLTVFSLLFWAFFEQAGSSMANFIDRNVDRVFESRSLTAADVGTQIAFRIPADTKDSELASLPLLTQEQLGRENGNADMADKIAEAIRLINDNRPEDKKLSTEKLAAFIRDVTNSTSLSITGLTALRDAASLKDAPERLDWKVVEENVGMGVGGSEIPASMFQAANPIYILLLGLVFTATWSFLAARGLEPSTPVKFALGIAQLALGFVALWYGAQHDADGRGIVSMSWLLIAILLHTTGELCSSPIGLSMVTKLSPKYLVSTVMGAWFVGLGLANTLSGTIAKLTGIGGDEGGGPQVVPLPTGTVHIYGKVFGQIAVWAFITAAVCLALSPLLTKWMHNEAVAE